MPTKTTPTPACAKAILMPCPLCGEGEATMYVCLSQIDDDDAQFTCRECDQEFGKNAIRDFIGKWTKLLAWLDTAPDMDAE